MKEIMKVATKVLLIIIIVICLNLIRRIFIAERFVVPSFSMAPTLVPGDRIWVNKTLMGPRIYKSLDFDSKTLKSFRIPGIRKVKVGDIIVFNYPHGYDNLSKIEFKINYVYCKRVVGCPGDRIGVVDGHCWNSRINRPIGVLENQEYFRWMNDTILRKWGSWYTFVYNVPELDWNSKNMGPIVVPKKGETVKLDKITMALYEQVIKYEGGLDSHDQTEYTFKSDWYWGMGDNSAFSFDSRFWGFIPEDYIIGIVGRKIVRNNSSNQTEKNDELSDSNEKTP